MGGVKGKEEKRELAFLPNFLAQRVVKRKRGEGCLRTQNQTFLYGEFCVVCCTASPVPF